MWTAPKIDWQATESFLLQPDYSRVCGNLLHLCELVNRLYPTVSLLEMADYTMEALPYLEFFANVEENLQRLYRGAFVRGSYSTRTLRENEPMWDFRDLNRIESIVQQLYGDLLTQQAAKPVLSFKMGGGAFASII